MLLVGWQEGHPACKNTEWWGAGVVICLERGADLHVAQRMPLPLTVSCFSKIQIGFTGSPGSPGKRAGRASSVCVWTGITITQWRLKHKATGHGSGLARIVVQSVWHWSSACLLIRGTPFLSQHFGCTLYIAQTQSFRGVTHARTHAHVLLTILCPGLPGSAGTRLVPEK